MSDHDDDYNDDGQTQEPGWRKRLESRATNAEKQAAETLARAEKAERRLAFAEAGVNLADPKSKWLLAGFDGDPTDKDAVLAAAKELGLSPQSAAAASEEVVTAEENAALDEIDRGNGGLPAGKAADLETQMRALYGRKDLSPTEQKAQLDALVAQAGLMPTG